MGFLSQLLKSSKCNVNRVCLCETGGESVEMGLNIPLVGWEVTTHLDRV